MNERFQALLNKAKENKELLIKVGGIVGGAILGAVVVSVVSAVQAQRSERSWDVDLDEVVAETNEPLA